MNLRVVAMAATGAVVTAALIGAAVALFPAPAPPVCFVQPLAAELGLDHLGLGADASGELLGRTPLDLRYEYLVGANPCPTCATCTEVHAASPDRRWWGCWQWEGDPIGQFVPDYVRETREAGAVPVFTWYTWLDVSQQDEGADALRALADPEPVAAWFDAYRFFLQRLRDAGEGPVVVHLEPDLWGFVQQAGGADAVPVAINATDPRCEGLSDDVSGLSRCLLTVLRDEVPWAKVGLHASHWGAAADALHDDLTAEQRSEHARATAAFLDTLGVRDFDLFVVEMSDRDAGFDGRHWEDDDFVAALTWASELAAATERPYLWWQIPVGTPDGTNACGDYQDNRLDWLLAHRSEVAEHGAVGVLFGGGAECMTDPNRDGGVFSRAVRAATDDGLTPLCTP